MIVVMIHKEEFSLSLSCEYFENKLFMLYSSREIYLMLHQNHSFCTLGLGNCRAQSVYIHIVALLTIESPLSGPPTPHSKDSSINSSL